MPTKNIDSYVAEYTGELLDESEHWAAYVTISAPSDNPMHMNIIVPKRRVAVEMAFADQQAAEAEAERAASLILQELHA